MLIVTGPISSGGKRLSHGDSIPEALTWSPHVLKTHIDAGRIRDVTEDEAVVLRAAVASRQTDNDARNRAQALQKAELAVANAIACHKAAVKNAEECAQSLASAESALAALKSDKPEPVAIKQPEAQVINELDGLGHEELREVATGLGVEFDKRWGTDRLRKELNEALAE